ncbi:MAG: hypothetical protein JNJ50_15030 [Acidobacteria bacterium]|nr:hypothetical protein [Acidobacteriota bacterium]
MKRFSPRTAMFVAILSAAVLSLVSFAQERRLPEEDWYGDAKRALTRHYVGKTVRAKLAIPATRRGLEMMDGAWRQPETAADTNAAQPGEELTIKSFKASDRGIELIFSKSGEKPKSSFNPFAVRRQPRINLRFSRELTNRDYTIESVNRWLTSALDVAALAPAGSPSADVALTEPRAALAPAPLMASQVSDVAAEAQSVPVVPGARDLPSLDANVGELTIECSDAQARIYIDDSYSGWAPRTIRLRAGVHHISVMCAGKPAWEQKLFIPGGKVSLIRVDRAETVRR